MQDRDVQRLKRAIRTRLNLEMSIAPAIVHVALRVRPYQVTLVPERRQELTTEGGLDVTRLSRRLKRLVPQFHARKILVSLFVDPVEAQIQAAQALGVEMIELHTGRYANASTHAARTRQARILQRAARHARQCGIAVAAGHGLDYRNVTAVTRIAEIEEANIGFSIVSRALAVGLARAVSDMVALLNPKSHHGRRTA